jgi:hypothetical protein
MVVSVLAGVVEARPRGDRLVVIDRVAAKGRARLLYHSRAAVPGLPVGSSVAEVAATLTVRVDDASGEYEVPAGAFDGRSGWRDNTSRRAVFVNRSAPGGETGVRKAEVSPSGGITLLAKSLGDVTPALDVPEAPAEAVDVRYALSSTSERSFMCSHFEASDCRYRTLAGGAGMKLTCDGGTADATCGAFDEEPPPPPPPPPPPGDFICTELIGFSQTLQWHETPEWKQHVVDDRWQVRFRAGGHVDIWSDPNADGWHAPVEQNCLGVGSPVLCTPCAEGSAAPDRVILTITFDAYEASVPVWVGKIRAAVATIRGKYPDVEQIVLQPVIGGPDHAVCPAPGEPRGVRASYNHPHVDAAIAVVVGDAADLVAGISPEVPACAAYEDDVGHLTTAGRADMGDTIGAYYDDTPD